MGATGRLATEYITKDRKLEEFACGFEFSGRTKEYFIFPTQAPSNLLFFQVEEK